MAVSLVLVESERRKQRISPVCGGFGTWKFVNVRSPGASVRLGVDGLYSRSSVQRPNSAVRRVLAAVLEIGDVHFLGAPGIAVEDDPAV